MAQLNNFSGGLATRLASHLINVSEATVYRNIDNESGILKSVNAESDTVVQTSKYPFYYDEINQWFTSTADKSYLEYLGRLFYTDGANRPLYTTSTNPGNFLGITPPAIAPPVADGGAGVISGTYTYVYTYYNSANGAESAPSPVSASISISARQVNVDVLASVDAQVTHIRLYRVGGTLGSFALVSEHGNSTATITDNIADTAVIGSVLDTTGGGAALAGAQFIREAYGMVFYMLDDKLYFSNIGQWYNFPPSNYLDFGETLTGYAFVTNGILVFTKHKTYLISGTTPLTFSKHTLSRSQGCKSQYSIIENEQGVLWVSLDGLCFSAGGKPSVVSRPKLGKIDLQVTNAVLHDDVYYAQLVDGDIFSFDTRYGSIFKYLSLGTTRLMVAQDKLYGLFPDGYKELFAGASKKEFSYTSPRLLDGAFTERKSYNSIYFRYSGDITIIVMVDNNQAATITLSGEDTYELDVAQKYKEGYSLQFIITGTGEVSEISYQAGGNIRP